jgi:hypothetical protein
MRLIAGIAVSIPAGVMEVFLLGVLRVVRYGSLREADRLSRGVLLGVCVYF